MIDPQDPESLFGMWSGKFAPRRNSYKPISRIAQLTCTTTAFHKCVGVLENGRRLENLSWRVFAHETLFVSKKRQQAQQSLEYFANLNKTQPIVPQKIPDLSSSIDSQSTASTALDDGDDGLRSPFDTRASVSTSLERCRTQDKHITPLDLQNLVTAIKEKQTLTKPLAPLPTLHVTMDTRLESQHAQDLTPTPTTASATSRNGSLSQPSSSVQESLPTPRPSSPRPVESSSSTIATRRPSPEFTSPSSASQTSPDSESAHPIVRGFLTGLKGASSYRSQSQLHLAPHQASRHSSEASQSEEEAISLPRKKGGMFTLGGSLTEDDNSVKDNMSPGSQKCAAVGHSSLRKAHKPQHQKHASFVEKPTEIPKKKFMLSTSAEVGNAIESDDDYDSEEEISESAIEEDDEEWEDEEVGSEENSKQLTFPRVDSRANLVSRRSVITQGLNETQRAAGLLQNAASQSQPILRRSRTSTPNGPSMPASPDESCIQLGSPASSSKPIALAAYNMGSGAAQIPLSPRATRRNMLTSELGVSLRKHMLNERQTRNGPYGAVAALQRRHTSHNVAGLTQYPGADAPSNTSSRNNSFNQYYDYNSGEYHQTGW